MTQLVFSISTSNWLWNVNANICKIFKVYSFKLLWTVLINRFVNEKFIVWQFSVALWEQILINTAIEILLVVSYELWNLEKLKKPILKDDSVISFYTYSKLEYLSEMVVYSIKHFTKKSQKNIDQKCQD